MVKTRKQIGKNSKYIKPTTVGKCPYCKKNVKALKQHIHDEHKGEKLPKK